MSVAYRVVAVTEAVTWVGLLVGMFFKYIAETGDLGVTVFGPIHGAVFVLYLIVTLVAARALRWSLWTTLFALAASVPPLATLIFEVWAERTGRLDPARAAGTAVPAA
ncbi:DUF3817 domain-containing protein [Nakamurella sp. YIM 132084]|uniref:DUF3817 domain-containing protein n=1 Tax=Nakamurella leprariae TaxID=2803911 RepID=A0A938Y9P3_9ACTN|nr:DUF3817 domain-containing protein [Nakamurella leprariae]